MFVFKFFLAFFRTEPPNIKYFVTFKYRASENFIWLALTADATSHALVTNDPAAGFVYCLQDWVILFRLVYINCVETLAAPIEERVFTVITAKPKKLATSVPLVLSGNMTARPRTHLVRHVVLFFGNIRHDFSLDIFIDTILYMLVARCRVKGC